MDPGRMHADLASRQIARCGQRPTAASRASERKLAMLYKRERGCRLEIVRALLPLARGVAQHYRRGEEPLDDLEQAATVGLLKALARFEPARGTSFASYAMPTISGELCRHYRSTGWAVHVPRGTQELALKVTRAERSDPQATPDRMAASFDVPVSAVLAARVAACGMRASSLDTPAASVVQHRADDSSDAGFEAAERRATLAVLTADLAERDRQVLVLRYASDLSQSEIGSHVGVSQMQVSRILRRVMGQLQEAAAVA